MRYAHSLTSMSYSQMDIKLKKPLDYINLVLRIIEHLLSWTESEDEKTIIKPYLVINSNLADKIQRAYIVKDNQIVSFAFPFHIYEKMDNSSGQSKWHVRYKEIDITSSVLSHCRGLYNDFEPFFEKKTFWEIATAQNLSDTDMLKAIQLFETLMLIEPAYVRYDYDPSGAKGLKHPSYHFDYNFTNICHYKIGLHSCINLHQIEDMINRSTDCWYVSKYQIPLHKKQKMLKARFTKKKKRNIRKQ